MLKNCLKLKPQPLAKRKKKKPQKEPLLSLAKRIYSEFKQRYANDRDFFNRKVANEIISNDTAHVVALFKDHLIADDTSEFLQRFYSRREAMTKLPKIYDYYQSCSVIFPNYVLLHEAKYICKNIQRKQCLIDHQQLQEEEMERKKNNDDFFEPSSDTVLDTNVYDSLLNATESNSVVMKAMGLTGASNKQCSEGKGDSIDKLIDYLGKHEEQREQKLKRKQKRQNMIRNYNFQKMFNTIDTEKTSTSYHKPQNLFLNNILTTIENKSRDMHSKRHKTKADQASHIQTTSSILTRNQKQAIASSLNNHSRQISNNTFSSPKLSSRIYCVVNKQIMPMRMAVKNTKVASPLQRKYAATISTNNDHVPRTSRESRSKPKLSCKLELFELITSKFKKNPNLSKKTIGNISTTTPSFSIKAQTHHSKPQKSETNQHRTVADNMHDKPQRKQVPHHRNTRNALLNKIHSGFFSSDFCSPPFAEIFKTTAKPVSFCNNMQRRADKVIKSFHIKGFEDMLKKRELGLTSSQSKREKALRSSDAIKSKSLTKRAKES